MRYRIGIYEPSSGPSGPSRYVESILEGLDRDEFEVVLFFRQGGPYRPLAGVRLEQVILRSPARRSDALSPELPARHFPVPKSQGRRWPAVLPGALALWGGFFRESRRLAACFARQPVDLLHTQNTGCEESAVAARWAGIPQVVGTFHVDSTYDLERRRQGFRHRLLEHLSNHCLDSAIAVSRATGSDWIRRTHLPPERVETIYNGVDAEQYSRVLDCAEARRRLGLPSDESLVVGGVGRLEQAKGFDLLLKAIALLAGRIPGLRLALAGQGPRCRELQEEARRLGIAERVHFLGFCPDVRTVYAALDVMALPSRCEALPYVLLEAMAAELPVVAAAVGGVSEVVLPGATGFLTPPEDPSALAAALLRLLENRETRRQMGLEGRERVRRHFEVRQMVARTLALYRQRLRHSALPLRKPTPDWPAAA